MLSVTRLASIFLLLPAMSALAASFDCAKARSTDEISVCEDPGLSALDDAAGRAYAAAIDAQRIDRNRIRSVAREFMTSRKRCGADRRCIAVSYVDVLGFYNQYGAQVRLPDLITANTMAETPKPSASGAPTEVGSCSLTEITDVPDKMADFGARAVMFANRILQIYYAGDAQEREIIDSRKGDKVIMCLTSLPRFCERPDDHRGKSYLVTNLRTKVTWWLTDSAHMCGGA